MLDRRALAIGLFAALIAMSQVESGFTQGGGRGQGGAPPQGRGGGRGGGGGGGGGRGDAGAFTPEPGAKDLKSVLFNWTWSMGMLRSGAESELIKTLDYQAEGGTIQVDGQPCTLTTYRVQVNYQIPGYRTQIACTRANGQMYSNVETMSGDYAWDETIPGAELVPGEGKATPRPGTLQERRIRLWASPQGAPKAALAAAAGMHPLESFGHNPAVLLDRQAAAGARSTATLRWEGDKPVITYPIPDVPGATATATLDERYLPERVVVTHGANTTEFVYSNWADWNNPLFKIEALYAGTLVERQNGTVLRTVNARVTEVGQIYVVVPVPESVLRAGK
jgi:hypothetical protein